MQTLICCQNWLCLAPIPIKMRAFMNYIENYDMIKSGNFFYKFTNGYFVLLFLYICLI